MAINRLTAAEAAELIQDGDVIGCSGFTPAGAVKVIPTAIAARAEQEHLAGRPFKVGVITGASTGDSLDGALARAEAVSFRTPYQANADMRRLINDGKARFFDQHLSLVAQNIRYGFYGEIDWAIIEAADVSDSGEIVLSTSVGISPTVARLAKKILIERNSLHPAGIRGIHDVYEPQDPPHRRELPIYTPSDRIGSQVLKVEPAKIVGVVDSQCHDEIADFKAPDATTERIGENVAEFLASEIKADKIPAGFLPVQSGVGNIANAVLGALGTHPEIPQFEMYTEVIQDSVIHLMKKDRVRFASGCSLTVSNSVLDDVYRDLDFFKQRVVLRPQELSNHPEIARRLGIIAINTAIEADLFGNINSTQVLGTQMMNGIGGSGDFTRNAYVSIFTTPSIAKGGKISAIVPMVTHVDHNEHSVGVLVTEQGVADLRCKSPLEKLETIIENCAHPNYRKQLRAYGQIGGTKHTPHTLGAAFGMHHQFLNTGDMRGIDWKEFLSSRRNP